MWYHVACHDIVFRKPQFSLVYNNIFFIYKFTKFLTIRFSRTYLQDLVHELGVPSLILLVTCLLSACKLPKIRTVREVVSLGLLISLSLQLISLSPHSPPQHSLPSVQDRLIDVGFMFMLPSKLRLFISSSRMETLTCDYNVATAL